jgi:acetyl-CoA carboxylase biotin carboxylase subunit
VDDFVITGPKTNLPFLAELLDDDGFRRGSYDTSVIDRLRS